MGATGYTALELMKILLRHPQVEITCLTSRQEGKPHVSMVHPQLAGRLDLALEPLGPIEVASRADCVFSCLPHGVTSSMVPQLLAAERRVIDFSADYRLDSAEVYSEWYDTKHEDPQRLGRTVYGLPELFGDAIAPADLVANPGCYPTSAILALAPLIKAGLIETSGIIVDSKSGVTGAGRTPKLTTHYPECNESISAYAVGRHRHTPEMEQVLETYSRPIKAVSDETLLDTLREFYANEPFVRVVDHLPGTKDTLGTNFCDITARFVRGYVITISCLDNMIKGASGAAVQNFNLMYGFDETTGLL